MRAQKKALPVEATTNGATSATVERYLSSSNILPHADSEEKSLFIGADEVARLLGVSRCTAYRCIQGVNKQAKARGLFVVRGLCNRQMFLEYVGYPGQ